MSTAAGPALEPLLRRLAETPAELRDVPRTGDTGVVHVDAVLGDLFDQLGLSLPDGALAAYVGSDPRRDRNRLSVALLQAWVLADPSLAAHGLTTQKLLAAFEAGATDLAPHTSAKKLVEHPERREELVRHLLARLDLHPAGERPEAAQDRLTSLSAAERRRVLTASLEAEQRAQKIREALTRKAAEESADKWTRE